MLESAYSHSPYLLHYLNSELSLSTTTSKTAVGTLLPSFSHGVTKRIFLRNTASCTIKIGISHRAKKKAGSSVNWIQQSSKASSLLIEHLHLNTPSQWAEPQSPAFNLLGVPLQQHPN